MTPWHQAVLCFSPGEIIYFPPKLFLHKLCFSFPSAPKWLCLSSLIFDVPGLWSAFKAFKPFLKNAFKAQIDLRCHCCWSGSLGDNFFASIMFVHFKYYMLTLNYMSEVISWASVLHAGPVWQRNSCAQKSFYRVQLSWTVLTVLPVSLPALSHPEHYFAHEIFLRGNCIKISALLINPTAAP